MRRVHLYYSGNVQGVGFRFTTVDVARKFDIKGWIKNCADGRVEVVAEAEDEILATFLKDLDFQMSYCIREKNIFWEPATETLDTFDIKY